MIIKQIFTEPETEVKWYFGSIEEIVIVYIRNRLRGTFACAYNTLCLTSTSYHKSTVFQIQIQNTAPGLIYSLLKCLFTYLCHHLLTYYTTSLREITWLSLCSLVYVLTQLTYRGAKLFVPLKTTPGGLPKTWRDRQDRWDTKKWQKITDQRVPSANWETGQADGTMKIINSTTEKDGTH